MVDPLPLCCAVNRPDPDDLVSSQTFFLLFDAEKALLRTQLLYLTNGWVAMLAMLALEGSE
jgi:hypothetical protein